MMRQYYIIDDLDWVIPYSLDMETIQKTKKSVIALFKETFPNDEIICIPYQDAKKYFQKANWFTIDLEWWIFVQSNFDFSITRTYTDESLSWSYRLLTRDGKDIWVEIQRFKSKYRNKVDKDITIMDWCIFSWDTMKIVTDAIRENDVMVDCIKVLVNNSWELAIWWVPIKSLYAPNPSEVIDILDMRDIIPWTKYGGASIQWWESVWYGRDPSTLERKLSIPSDKTTIFKNQLDQIVENLLAYNQK